MPRKVAKQFLGDVAQPLVKAGRAKINSLREYERTSLNLPAEVLAKRALDLEVLQEDGIELLKMVLKDKRGSYKARWRDRPNDLMDFLIGLHLLQSSVVGTIREKISGKETEEYSRLSHEERMAMIRAWSEDKREIAGRRAELLALPPGDAVACEVEPASGPEDDGL